MKKFLIILSLLLGTTMAHALPFETTTSPDTYPIRWYYLKANGYYLHVLGDELAVSTSASSSDDYYLWCFVTTSQGKTVIYNKGLKKYQESGFYFSQYMYTATNNYVDYSSGNSFYICFNQGNTKNYLDADEQGVTYSTSAYTKFTAISALYEDLIDPAGTLDFPEPTVYDDYCTIAFNYIPGDGDSGRELILFINGTRVGMPYSIQRTNEVQTVEATARVEFSNTRIRPIEVTKTFEIPALEATSSPIVTTPSPTTLPIHWYQLKVNDKYVYYDPEGDIFHQIKLTTTPSTENNFLWCFVEASSDKTVIYNRDAKKYINSDYGLTNDINYSYICYIEMASGNNFYIKYYHSGDNRIYYLVEYEGELVSVDKIASTFNAIEILVEEETVPVTDVTLTPYNVYTPNNVQTDPAEDYYKLFDKNKSTKWCVDNSTGSWETIWVDFKSDVAFTPTSYTMTTGNDTHSWSGRNPKKWKIYAKAQENDSWTTIVDVTDGDALGLGIANTTDYTFNIDGVSTKYQFFRFEVSEVRGKGGWQNNHYVFQLAELALSGYTSSSAVTGDVNGDGYVTAADVTAIYDYMLNNVTTYVDTSDVNGDGYITSSDITAVYNILLGN